MVAVRVEVNGVPNAGPTNASRPETLSWQEDVAPGETLGRLLARLAFEHSLVRNLYDPASRRFLGRTAVRINGRAYNLLGGLTYTLHEGDTITLSTRDTSEEV